MGMFGGSKTAAKIDPSQLSGSDKLMLFGATLRDVGGNLRGENGDAILQAQSLMAARQQQQQRLALMAQLGGLMGGQPQSTMDQTNAPQVGLNPPGVATSAAVPPSDPRWQKAGLMADSLGLPLTSTLKLLEMNKPQYEEGVRVNPYDQAAPAFIPKRSEGMAPQFQGGQVASMGNIPGYTEAAAQNAGAVAGAQEQQKAAWDLVKVDLGKGQTVMLPRAVAAPLLAARAGKAAEAPDLGVSQSPAEQAADTARATAQAGAQVELPQTVQVADQALGLIDQIKTHPALNDRTGLKGVLPAIPGTPGKDFDTLLDQLKGKLFLQAYQGLKGAGQITEVEGKKATEAMARLNQAQSHQGFVSALNDLQAALKAGRDRAANQAQRPELSPAASHPSALTAVPLQDRMAEARRRGLIK